MPILLNERLCFLLPSSTVQQLSFEWSHTRGLSTLSTETKVITTLTWKYCSIAFIWMVTHYHLVQPTWKYCLIYLNGHLYKSFLFKHDIHYNNALSESRDVIYQTPEIVFHHISNHREESWKYDEIRGIWKSDETLYRVFDISSQLKQKLRNKRGNKIVKLCLLDQVLQTTVTVMISSVFTWWIILNYLNYF